MLNVVAPTVIEVARVMTEENRVDVLPRFFGLSRQEAREVAAEIDPAGFIEEHCEVLSRPGGVAQEGGDARVCGGGLRAGEFGDLCSQMGDDRRPGKLVGPGSGGRGESPGAGEGDDVVLIDAVAADADAAAARHRAGVHLRG